MDPKLSFQVVWQDDDMVEIDVQVSNGEFSGRAQVYTSYDVINKLAKELTGFPKSSNDKTEFTAGERDSLSFLSIRFYSFDAAGHTALHASMESNVPTEYRPEMKSKLQVEMQFEANQIDAFANRLLTMVKAQDGCAVLEGIRPYTQNIPHRST